MTTDYTEFRQTLDKASVPTYYRRGLVKLMSKEGGLVERLHAGIRSTPEVGARALILLAAFVSFVISVVLWFGGHHEQGIFVGLWVPSILSLGAVVLGRSER
jgi:hypothetical protein